MQRLIIEKGKSIYYKLKPTLEKKYDAGDYITIDVSSGKYFIGKTPIEALHRAKRRFPRKQFFLAQVGGVAGALK